jgi:hypothetical protein
MYLLTFSNDCILRYGPVDSYAPDIVYGLEPLTIGLAAGDICFVLSEAPGLMSRFVVTADRPPYLLKVPIDDESS